MTNTVGLELTEEWEIYDECIAVVMHDVLLPMPADSLPRLGHGVSVATGGGCRRQSDFGTGRLTGVALSQTSEAFSPRGLWVAKSAREPHRQVAVLFRPVDLGAGPSWSLLGT